MNMLKVCFLLFVLLVASEAQKTTTLRGIIRDQASDRLQASCGGNPGTANGGRGFPNIDFELATSGPGEKGLVKNILGADGTPEYAYSAQSPGKHVTSPQTFYTWFHNTNQTVNIPIDITLSQVGSSNVYQFESNAFFPIDGRGWKDTCGRGFVHNYGFCLEIHSRFGYTGSEIFSFTGDDDVWVYIDKKLVVDLGGIHTTQGADVRLNTTASLQLQVGNSYTFDLFYCERKSTGSNLRISTSLDFYCAYYDWCGVCEGNGQSCCNASTCTDNNACTIDSCPVVQMPSNETCIHTPVTCPASTNPCTVSFCDPILGCTTRPLDCNDGNLCTIDTCRPNVGCQYIAVECSDNNACTTDTCSPTLGCQHTPITCAPIDKCTSTYCNTTSGCVSSPLICDDGDRCTTDTCDLSTGCRFTDVECDDGNACTVEACDRQVGCISLPLSCDDGNACTVDSCSASTGCEHAPLSCDDGDACTVDSCSVTSGCIHTPVLCDDGSECTLDTCDSAFGCLYSTVVCDDHNACTIEACNNSTGCELSEVSCNDNNACTFDSCNSITGCDYTSVPCDDFNACTVDSCDPQLGCQHTSVSCDDSNECTIDSCSASTGCEYTPVQCDDGNACTEDSCDAEFGCRFAAIVCNDGDSCTIDSCNATSGCISAPVQCTDQSACTVDSCDPETGSCRFESVACDDQNACTEDSCDATVGCTFNTLSCDDNNACTVDSCNSTTGCLHTLTSCDDGNACTTDSCDGSSGCLHNNITCSDNGLPTCGVTFCSPTNGCQYSPVIDAYWENVKLTSWVDNVGLKTQWNAVLKTGNIALHSVKYSIHPQVRDMWNAPWNPNGYYELPVWQYRNGEIPPHSSYVSFGYTIDGPNPANISLFSGICAPAYTGCSVVLNNLLVNSWVDGTGVTTGQYNLKVTNTGTRVIANVNVKIDIPSSGELGDYWNMVPGTSNGQFRCELWNLYPGQSSQTCGFNVKYSSNAPNFDVTNISPLCI